MTRVEKSTDGKIVSSVYAACLFALTLGFFAPSSIFFPNRLEFSPTYTEILGYLIPVTAALGLLLTVLLFLLPRRIFSRGVSLMVALSVLLWFQGNVLKWEYGVFDGRDILWGGKVWCGVIDSLVWCLFLCVAMIKPGFFRKRLKTITHALLLVQGISLGFAVSQAPAAEGRLYLKIDRQEKYVFSERKNAVLMVLDTFQTEIFQEIIKEDHDIKHLFRDFIYFRNSLGGYPTTWPAVPLILTGKYYDNSHPFSEFKKEVFGPASLPAILKRRGFRVHLFPFANSIFLRKELASNIIRKQRADPVVFRDVLFIYDIALFRNLPHFLKSLVIRNQQWLLRNLVSMDEQPVRGKKPRRDPRRRLLFFHEMPEQVKVDGKAPTFKFYHLQGVHPPLHLDRECREIPSANDRKHYKNQAVCMLRCVGKWLEVLKKNNIYENTLILIIGDHGPGNWGITDINPVEGQETKLDARSKKLRIVKSGALPLILIKPLSGTSKDGLTVSDRPVSLGDIARTVAVELGIGEQLPGESMFNVPEHGSRERRYFYYKGFNIQSSGYFKEMAEYRVRGFSWHDGAWSGPVGIHASPDQ